MPLKDKLLNKIRSIDPTFYARNEILLKHSYLEDRILKTNGFTLSTERFNCPLFSS